MKSLKEKFPFLNGDFKKEVNHYLRILDFGIALEPKGTHTNSTLIWVV